MNTVEVALDPANPPSALRAIERHEALSRLSPSSRARLASEVTWIRARRGEALWRVGEPSSRLLLVVRGMVALHAAAARGKELILGLCAPVEGLDESTVLSGEAHGGDAFAFGGGALVASVPRAAALEALRSSGAASLALAGLIARRHREADRRLCASTLSVEQRIAQLLIDLTERFGDELDGGSRIIPLRLTRGHVGALVGTTAETAIRALSRWSREGLVSTGDGGVVIHDFAAIEREAGLSPPSERAWGVTA